ncbi:MAG: YidC/Oxa1 family membrane protein insertase [Selenomonadaceae bacterium]|nr:YidC/Oxa1 family membrane protein insertase [Selenomonadaceae bacterium]
MGYIYRAFGFILKSIYDVFSNYGIAVILLTLVIKLIVLPLTLKQQKSMTKMQRIQPKLKELQEKYKYDKERASQETMKLYKEYGVNPMGGCLPLLIQFPILIAMYRVIQQPAEYVLGYGKKALEGLYKTYEISSRAAGAQIELAEKLGLNFDFFGLDLARTPWTEFSAFLSGKAGAIALTALIIPILSGVTTYLTSKITTLMNKDKNADTPKAEAKPQRILSPDQKKDPTENPGESMTKSMTYFMPFMTLWLTFTFPAALGLYWTISNVLTLVQTVVLNGYYNKKLAKELEEQDKIREAKIQEKIKKYNLKKKKRG